MARGAQSMTKALWRVAMIAAVVGLAGCAERPTGNLIEVGARAPDASLVDMLVATTRAPVNDQGVMFGGERAHGLRFADIAVSIPSDATRKIGEIQWPASVPGDPSKDFVTRSARILDLADARADFDLRVDKSAAHDVLVFVHGYNTRFEEAVYRFAQIAHDSRADIVPVLFTWPSRGKALSYFYDRESANYSRDALEALLDALQRDPAVSEVDILAHSMGNWVTLEALRQMAIRDKRLAPKIRQVMLASPDVDVDVFRRQIKEIGDKRPPFTVFVSRDDQALRASRVVWGDMPRLGAVDPDVEPYASMFRADRITPIDLTALKTPDSLNHSKFTESPEVVRMIGTQLASGQSFSEKPGIGGVLAQTAAGAGATVGSAAGLVISAPLAVVDGRTRDEMGERLNSVGDNLSSTVSGGY